MLHEVSVSRGSVLLDLFQFKLQRPRQLASEEMDLVSKMSQLCEACEKPDCEYCRGFNSADEVLLEASGQGRVECVGHALAAGANVNGMNTRFWTPLMVASIMGHADCVNVLIKAGADVNRNVFYNTRVRQYTGDTALILAAGGGHDKCLVYLIEAGAIVNVRTRGGNTALMRASQTDSHESVNVLIEAGADVNMKNREQHTALYLAVKSGSSKSVDHHLIAAGADVNYMALNLLALAAVSRNVTNMKLLFRAGIPINTGKPNALIQYITYTKFGNKMDKMIFLMLCASGECIGGRKTKLDLKAQCRRTIRKHLLDLDPHTHLFDRAQRLGLPKPLQRYLVRNVNIYDDCETTAADGDNNNNHNQVQRGCNI